MENEIKVGEYVRTDEGEINRITKILNDDSDVLTYYCFENNMGTLEKSIVKHSSNILDILEVRRFNFLWCRYNIYTII